MKKREAVVTVYLKFIDKKEAEIFCFLGFVVDENDSEMALAKHANSDKALAFLKKDMISISYLT